MAKWKRGHGRRRRGGWPVSMYYYAEEADDDGATAAGDIGSGDGRGDAVAPQTELAPCAPEFLEAATEKTGKTHGEEEKTE